MFREELKSGSRYPDDIKDPGWFFVLLVPGHLIDGLTGSIDTGPSIIEVRRRHKLPSAFLPRIEIAQMGFLR